VLRRRRTRSREVVALKDVDLDVVPGTALGVVGANGAGKSTLLTVIAGILPADRGTVETSGRVVSLLELGAGFHPDFTGRENVLLNASIHGMTRTEIERRMDSIIAFAELEQFIDAPVRTYSTGMYMRLGFAVATSLDPEILLLDEVLAVGDSAFQQKCMGRIAEFQRSDATIVFVSHNRGAVELVCDRAVWLANGRIQADGDPRDVLDRYELGLASSHATSHAADGAAHGATHGANWRSCRITGVRLTDGEEPTDRFLSGDPFVVEVEYETLEPVGPAVTLMVMTAEGGLMTVSDNRHDHEPIDAPPGHRTARFVIDALPLLEGRFTINVLLDPPAGGDSFHRWERCADFTVFARGRGYGPVALPGTWSLEVGSQHRSPL
jgi:ABC-type polysaccharide/polyol phosphate transport system ATPase subunit